MKKNIFKRAGLLISAALITLPMPMLTSCEDVPMPYNNPLDNKQDEPDVVVIDPTGDGTKDNPYNVAGVLEYIGTLEAGVESDKDVYVKGVVTAVKESFTTQYGNATFTMSDDDEGSNQFTFYRGLYFGNKKYSSESDVNISEDDVVVICGRVMNYGGNTPETSQGKAYVVTINDKTVEPTPPSPSGEAKGSGTQADPYNVAGVLSFIGTLGSDVTSTNEVYIQGKVKEIKEQFGTQYGNATFTMADDGSDAVFTAYRILYLGNVKYTEGTLLKAGDEVVVCGKVVNFRGNTPETAQNTGYLYSLNGATAGGGANNGGGDNPATGTGSLESPFTPAQANAFVAALAADETTSTDYYIKGKIISIADNNQFGTQYGNCTFYISDDGTDKDDKFYVFRTLYLGNVKYSDDSWTKPKAGDEVIICGKLVNYRGNTPETSANNSYIYSLNGATK